MSALQLDAESLLSKWGFNDGDEPDAYLDYLDAHCLPYPRDWHGVLVAIVKAYFPPILPPGVELYDIETSHNPIRIARIAGEEVDVYDPSPAHIAAVAGISVTIDFAIIFAIQIGLEA